MARNKIRLDELLVKRGFYSSKDDALRACIAGEVLSDTEVLVKPGLQVNEDIPLNVRSRKKHRFVSRGGEKLDGALTELSLDVAGLRCIDLGASTGGFTDCLLKAGAASVAAVDVGYGQLAWSLQTDARVTVFDRTNIKLADPMELGAPFDMAVADLSFIGLAPLLPVISTYLCDGGIFLALIKPQFESERDEVAEGGVVLDENAHIRCLGRVCAAAAQAALPVEALCFSRVPGEQAGNIEYFALMRKCGRSSSVPEEDITALVRRACNELRR